MNGIARRQVLLGAGLCAGGLAAGLARLRPGTVLFEDPDSLIPAEFGDWQAITASEVVLPPQDDLSARIYDSLIVRSYRQPGVPAISLVIAYGTRQDYSFQLHRPEICYPASGYRVSQLSERPLAIGGKEIPGNTMLARRGNRTDCVLYWTRIGDAFPQSTWQQRLAIARGVTDWRLKEGALVRFATRSENPENMTEDVRRLETFATSLIARMDGQGRQLLLGDRFRMA